MDGKEAEEGKAFMEAMVAVNLIEEDEDSD